MSLRDARRGPARGEAGSAAPLRETPRGVAGARFVRHWRIRPCLALLGALWLCPVAARPLIVHAAPGGAAQGDCSRRAPCSLEAAQARVRVLLRQGRAPIEVRLGDGLYRLRAPLRFDARDSGAPRRPVRWLAEPGARSTLAGSLPLRGRQADGLWVFALPPGDLPTSIYLDGRRRWPARSAACLRCKVDAKGFSGLPEETMRGLQPGSVAVIHVRWRDFRCRVVALGPGRVDLAQPCWRNTAIDSRNGWSAASPVGKYYAGVDWLENLAVAPAEPGRFTVDGTHSLLRYRPRPGEAAQPPRIELPLATQLLRLEGSPQAPVHDLIFSGLGFAYTEWHRADSDDGYVSLQAGYLIDGARAALPDDGEGMTRTASAVEVIAGRDIAFDRARFAHLAAAGIALAGATHGAAVTRSVFTDLGAGAIFVGDIEGHPADPANKTSDVRVADNRIDHVALAYRDNVAIMGGFVDGLEIAHNTLHDLPYSGISVGWGWNFEGPGPVESAIRIVGNRIERVMLQLADGGAIYTQGASTAGSSYVARNAVDMRRSGEGNGIYLDEHSYDFDVERNVLLGTWVSAWADWSGNLRIVHNWTDTAGKPHNPGPGKIWFPNGTGLARLPAAALAVQRAAGVRAHAPAPVLPIRVGAPSAPP